MEEHVRSQVRQVGTDAAATLVVAWAMVAAAVVLDGSTGTGDGGSTGQYA